MTKYYETLCSNHNDIIFKVQQLEKYLEDNILILDQPWCDTFLIQLGT